MNKQTKFKVLVLSMAMAFGMLSSVTASAQGDGFFGGDSFGGDRLLEAEWYLSNNGIGQFAADWAIINNGIGQAPIGTGLLILTAAGAGYAALKRKRN